MSWQRSPPAGAVPSASSSPPRVAGSVPMDAVRLRAGTAGLCAGTAGSFSGSAAVLGLLTLLSAVRGKSFRLVALRAGRARVYCRCGEADAGSGRPCVRPNSPGDGNGSA